VEEDFGLLCSMLPYKYLPTTIPFLLSLSLSFTKQFTSLFTQTLDKILHEERILVHKSSKQNADVRSACQNDEKRVGWKTGFAMRSNTLLQPSPLYLTTPFVIFFFSHSKQRKLLSWAALSVAHKSTRPVSHVQVDPKSKESVD
jgi:hypothetical protein